MKKLLVSAKSNTLDAHLDLEQTTLVDVLGTAGPREGVMAFLDKRKPDFAGAEGR